MGVVASLLIGVLWLFVIVILVRVVFSWVGPFGYGGRNYGRRSSGFLSSVSDLAFRITEPVLAPVRRRLPPMSGMDLSPLVVTVACYFLIHALGFVGN
ncbi:MAG: YggT family protein [Chloroflexota bacterium]|nr:YggT family protein [Chloroflexota bacterium]